MGTRNLTMVILNGETKVAQYGQWDGSPSGQGTTALTFLVGANLDHFKDQLKKVRFMNAKDDAESENFMRSIGCKDGWMNGVQADKFHAKYPYQNRDHGAEVLNLIQKSNGEAILLVDSTDFAGNSLFCEFAYVIDFDKGTFEVYKGFNKTKLPKNQRFAHLKGDESSGYKPVKLKKSYSLDSLPTVEQFLKENKG